MCVCVCVYVLVMVSLKFFIISSKTHSGFLKPLCFSFSCDAVINACDC